MHEWVASTIGIQQIVGITLMNWIDLTGGPQGVRSTWVFYRIEARC